MKRIKQISLVLLLMILAQRSLGQERPNILFVYTDDQSHRTVGCYPESHDWVRTPNIDELANQGVRFSHAYIGSWCMASRATLLTGHHQHGIESMRMKGKYPGSQYDPKKCRFWPSVFRANGYTTAHIGKWHTGVDAGFGRDWDFQKVWNRPRHPENAPNYYANQLISTNGQEPEMVKGYSTDNYTQWAIDYIEGKGRATDKPWYLWLCYGAVHGPFTPADRHLNEYADAVVKTPTDIYPPRVGKPDYVDKMEFWEPGPNGIPVERKVRELGPVGMKDMPGRPLKDWVRQYNQGVIAIDEGVGRLMKALKDSGQDENTLVVFTSDQGFAWGQHGFKSKVAPYRATVEAPLIIRPPKRIAAGYAGRVVDAPVSGVDLPPTFFAQSGIELPWKMHGHDLSPLFEANETKWNHPAMLVHTAKTYGSATQNIPVKDDPELYHGPGIPWYVMLSQGRYKYVRTLIAGETEELYDLDTDLEELHNLAHQEKHDPLLEKMRAQAIAELKRTDAGLAEHLPPVGTIKARQNRKAEKADKGAWIIDTHTHFKGEEQIAVESKIKKRNPKDTLGQVVRPEDYKALADRLGIQSTMVVEAVEQAHPQFNDWLFEHAKKSELVCGYVARGDLNSDKFLENHNRYLKSGFMKGYRFRIDELHGYLDKPNALAHLKRLERDSMVIDLLVEHRHTEDVIQLAKQFPKLKIVINHCFRARIKDGQLTDPWKAAVTACSKHANVYCKLSSIVNFAGTPAFSDVAPTDLETYRPLLQHCYESFGEDRVIFGTNWAVCTHFGRVDDVVRIVSEFLKSKGELVLRKGMRDNAIRVYGIEVKHLR
ncbi:sulfatase-like hydrolase/transferase [Mariniblastus sp.]|nr:sulfatase-like hydrolase/transferase [Mariniblastus sp.]